MFAYTQERYERRKAYPGPGRGVLSPPREGANRWPEKGG